MDELEFRKRVLAQPNDLDSELKEYAEQDPERAQFVQDSKALDEQLKAALDIPVPEGLAERLMQHTADETETQPASASVTQLQPKAKKTPWYLAIAATLMLSTGAFVYHQTTSQAGLGEYALAHVYHEMNSLTANEQVNINDVNKLLAEFGGSVSSLPGKVTYLRHCDFEGKQSVHLVVQTQTGPVTVFFVPNKHGMQVDDSFEDQRFKGQISEFPAGEAILLAERSTPVNIFSEQLNQAVRWN